MAQTSKAFSSKPIRKLNIGGEQKKENWEVLNINDAPYVDHVCDAINLSRFEDETFDVVYASHILEHFDFDEAPETSSGSFLDALKEWYRVLKTSGKLLVAVPDMDEMCKLLLDKNLPLQDRITVTMFVFGGHTNKYNYHCIAFDKEMLGTALKQVGFKRIWEVEQFNLFNDSSCGGWKTYRGLSLNLIAEKE